MSPVSTERVPILDRTTDQRGMGADLEAQRAGKGEESQVDLNNNGYQRDQGELRPEMYQVQGL